MESQINNINSIDTNSNPQEDNINQISEENEFQKMSRYFEKIKEYQDNNYRNCLSKSYYCDCFVNGEWMVAFIEDIQKNSLSIKLVEQFYKYENTNNYEISIRNVAYFRKHTKPQSENIIKQRYKKNQLVNRIKEISDEDKKNIFKEEQIEEPKKIFEYYYFMHSTLYKALDYSICKSKDKSSGVEEGFRIIILILEFLSEFYHYISNNFEEFLNYKNNIVDTDLADLVLFNKKYAIFSFWDDANLLMNKIFLNNKNYLDWFNESEKILQKIIPSSSNFKKITSNDKLLCPLYEDQIFSIKNQNYNYSSRNGNHNIKLKRICIENAYKNFTIEHKGYKFHAYILAYFIDYFYALGGYNALFSICQENQNVKIASSIFNNIIYAYSLTNNFFGIFESERNGINLMIFKFLDSINSETLKTYNKSEIINFLQKACRLYPNISTKNTSSFFEEIYIRFILKILNLAKNSKQKLESLNEINNILISIEYNQLFNENNYQNKNSNEIKNIDELINNPKYETRDRLVKEMTYHNFCLNCKNSQLIEALFGGKNNNNVSEDIIINFTPILIVMYQNNFGCINSDTIEQEVNKYKKIVFDVLLNKLKESEKENINFFGRIIRVFCELCEVLTDEDKFFIFSEIKTFFYNSFYSQNTASREFFNFIINYSVIAVKKTNIYEMKRKESIKEKKHNINSIKDNVDKEEINSSSFDEKKYYGLELVYNHLYFDIYDQVQMMEQKKLDYINIASKGVVNIISNMKEPKPAINIILNKIFDSIKNKKDVLQHLLLLNRFLNYEKIDNFSIEFEKDFEEYLQRIELIIILIDELFDFLDNLEKNKIVDINSVNENEISTNINNIEEENSEGFLNENYNIKTRIRTIFNVILKYNNTTFDYNKIETFFKKLIRFNEFCKNTLYQYLLNNINKLSKDFLIYLYSNIISKSDIFSISDSNTYNIFKNIIIEINKKSNILLLVNNQDLGIILNKNDLENELVGMNLLWDLLINGKQNLDNILINDITDFLCNIYFGSRIKSPNNIFKDYEEYWLKIINKISEKLKSLTEKKQKNEKAIKFLILVVKKIISKVKNCNGEIIKNISEIEKESNKFIIKKIPPKEYTFIGNKVGKESNYILDIKLNSGDLFYILRYKLSYFYNIPLNQVGISVYINTIGKIKKISSKDMEKLHKNPPLKEFNYLFDFTNIYEQLNLLYENQGKKKLPLIIEVTLIKEIYKDILKINPIDTIYKKSQLPIILMNLLKEPEAPYTFDALCLIKEDNDSKNSNVINKEIENIIQNNKKSDIFDFRNTSIYYISYIINGLNNVLQNNLNDKFIDKFLKNYIWNDTIKNLNIINDEHNSNNNKKNLPLLGELYEKYNLINNLVNIYVTIAKNLGKDDSEQIWLIIYKIIKIYKYIINESIHINLNECGKSDEVTIEDIKRLFNESLFNINNLIINNEKILNFVINSIISQSQDNEIIQKIKNTFEYIIFVSILTNKYKSINKRIKELIIELINKLKPKSNKPENKMFFNYLLDLYLNQKTFEKIIQIFKEINYNTNINTYKYENNAKIFFQIICSILENLYEFIKDKLSIDEYIDKILLPKIYNIYIPYFPLHSIFNQIMLGGICKIFYTLLIINDDINIAKYKELINYLYDNVIMSKCNENILTPENINSQNNNSVAINSTFCLIEATNLFILLLFKNYNPNDINNNYIQKLTSYHNLCYWKGNELSHYKLYYKENQKSTPFVGLKNLGCTCYINSLVQTFYHIPLFQESILKCDYVSPSERDCFYQLKKIFYSLKYLQTSYYTPLSFMKNYDNQPLDVKMQMDAFEFFFDFLDKIEQKLKNTKNKNIIKYFFMGRQNDVLTFEGNCTHHRTNESSFYSIQLQVQGKKNIYDSLDSLIEGEKMSGDNCIYCEQCKAKLPATKSQNFKVLPRIFMFVLKRFEFNYQTMQKTKINDYYEFPLTLDMNKYTENFINNNKNEDNKYRLKSIIVHTGNCESGHYYTFILDDKSNEWYEFNDTKVQKFNIEKIDEEAYGKKEIINDDRGNKIEVENVRNAYMLFYEKINKDNCEKFENIEVINEILNEEKKIQNINEEDDDFNLLSNDTNEETSAIQNSIQNNEMNDIIKPLNEEMFRYFLNQKLFSGEYHHFVLSLFINILNYYNPFEKISFSQNLCSNNDSYILSTEIVKFKKNRKTLEKSNIENYLLKKKIFIIDSNEKLQNINSVENNEINKEEENKLLELFKNLIIYFFNVLIRAREKDYLGGTVNLIKYMINSYIFCSDYLIEEFSNYNILIEYMINCPNYEIKKLIVGIIYCAMLKSITSYENQMREQLKIQKQNDSNNNSQIQEKNTKDNKKKEKKDKKKDKKEKEKEKKKEEKNDKNEEEEEKNKEDQKMSDEECARKLQEELNQGYEGESDYSYNNMNYNNSDNSNSNKNEENSNPLERKFIPSNVLKLIYNTLALLKIIKFSNMNEARFLYLILYRFSLISKKTKKFLLNKALVLEFLNVLLMENLINEEHNDAKILNTMNKGKFTANHCILNIDKKEIVPIYDKGGAFHYENYMNLLYFNLLSHNQKSNAKRPYFEGRHNFDNKRFVRALFFRIHTRQDAYAFSNLIITKCDHPKNYKKRIEIIFHNLLTILDRADNNDKINYDINSNRDNYYKGAYSENISNDNIDLDNDFPKINPKYILLILKRFIIFQSDNKKAVEHRASTGVKQIFILIQRNCKYYNYTIMIIDFLIELFTNYKTIMNSYVSGFIQNFKEVIQWLKNHPISPELYPIEGICMFRSDNVAYRQNITEEEKIKFNSSQMEKTEKRIEKLNNIIEMKVKDYDYDFEVDFDLTDFKFRKGDYIYYKKQKAIIKEYLDELIFIKIIEKDKNDKNAKIVKDKDEISSISDFEKIYLWVAKDDKNISIYNLE